MGLPPVVVGLFVYLMLSRAGPLGELGLLFTPTAMVIAQAILVTPIVAALTRQTVEDLYAEYREQLQSLGVGPLRAIPTLLWDGRYSLLTAVLAGFGRAAAEVGAVIIVGGNINHVTRVMTTTIALETSKGYLALALGLGFVLLADRGGGQRAPDAGAGGAAAGRGLMLARGAQVCEDRSARAVAPRRRSAVAAAARAASLRGRRPAPDRRADLTLDAGRAHRGPRARTAPARA